MNRSLKFCVIAFLLQAVSFKLPATGLTFIRNYPPYEYKASSQNWSVVQDQRGVMYFGNNDGVLIYDAASWRLVKVPGVGPLAIDSKGTVYVGLDNNIGYLKPDKLGNFQFHSLMPEIPEQHREINICYHVYAIEDQVIFQTSDKIYLYRDGKFNVIASETGFRYSFLINNRFYVTEAGNGLLVLQDNSLHKLIKSELFNGGEIIAILPYKKNSFHCSSEYTLT